MQRARRSQPLPETRPDGPPAEILVQLAKEGRVTLAALSRAIGRREGYLRTFVLQGIPANLEAADRELLGVFFLVPASWFDYDRD